MAKVHIIDYKRITSPYIEETGVRQLIRRRRRQILVHSCIYYRLGTSIITDKQFDEWARELVDLQNSYPQISKSLEFYEDFKNWDATTGFNLPSIGDPRIVGIATSLVKSKNKYK